MRSSKKELQSSLSEFSGLPVLVVGDIILDRYVWGTVDRISPEAPVPIVAVTRTEDRLGGAGNVVRNLVNLGAKVSLCGFIGDDAEGEAILQMLDSMNVNKEGILIDRGKPTTLKTRVIAQSQQVVRIDREELLVQGGALREGFAALVEAQVAAARAVIFSDYGKGAISDSVLSRFSSKEKGPSTIPLVLDPHPVNYAIYQNHKVMTVAKPNRREAESATGIKIVDRSSALSAGNKLLSLWGASMVVITLGEDGMVIVSENLPDGLFLDTVALEVYDVSGAGDTVTAVFALAQAIGAAPSVCGELANIAAGIVVSEVGTVAIEFEELNKGISHFFHTDRSGKS